MYRVMAQLDEYGDKTGEYTGEVYERYEDAKQELIEARQNTQIFHAWIEEVE